MNQNDRLVADPDFAWSAVFMALWASLFLFALFCPEALS